MKLLLSFSLLLSFFASALFVSKVNGEWDHEESHYSGSGEERQIDDYTIYELIDRLVANTGLQTFYELLDLPEDADKGAISAAFRKKSRLWHPDRHVGKVSAEEASLLAEKAAILGQAVTILRNEETRKRYDWILNEAPAWHKSGYIVKKYCMTAKLSILQVFGVILAFITLIQLLSQLARLAEYRIRRWNASQILKSLNKSETKRLDRKLDKGSVFLVLILFFIFISCISG